MDKKLGSWAFLVGIVVSLIAGLVIQPADLGSAPSNFGSVTTVLVVLGLIVGYLNITPAEATQFLVANLTLLVASSSIVLIPFIGPMVKYVLTSVIIFCSSAAVVVALRQIYNLAVEK